MCKRRAEARHRLGLVCKVEFERQRLLQVINNRLELDRGRQPRNRLDDLLQDCQVRRHQVLDVRVLHLDRHLPPVVQPCAMYLCNRSSRDRLPLDLREHICWTLTQLAGDGLLYLRPGTRWHPILQGRQGADIDGRKEIRTRGGELAGLNQRSAERDGRLQYSVRAALVLQLPVPWLYQRRQPLRSLTQRRIADEDIRRDGGHHQGAREGLTDRNHARGMFLHREPGLRPEKRV